MSVPNQTAPRPGLMEFVTWRLSQSPSLEPPPSLSPIPRADYGPRWLLRPEIAALVEEVLFRAQDEWKLIDLDSWAILPNQVHFLMRPHGSSSAVARHLIREATEKLARRAPFLDGGPFWQSAEVAIPLEAESEIWRARQAIRRAPVTEGLVTRPEQWFFSSASRRFEDFQGAA